MSKYETTQEQFKLSMSKFKGTNLPVENESTWAVHTFKSSLKNSFFRLPTETEWEYACRAGTSSIFSFGSDTSNLGDYAWYAGNSMGRTHPVGQKKPNAWGLYDMHGNVAEYCYKDENFSSEERILDPSKIAFRSNYSYVLRGGGWNASSDECRSDYRIRFDYSVRSRSNVGFRLVYTGPVYLTHRPK